MEANDKTIETRQRLLEAAGEVFATQGFRNTTIREICLKAGANVAAVHYHFGDKEELYAAVFDFARSCSIAQFNEIVSAGAPVEQRLQSLVHAVLARFFDEGRPAWFGKLVAREMIEPTSALDGLVNGQIRTNAELLKSIVRELVNEELDEQELWRCTFSIASQWLFYFHNGQIIKRLNPDQRFGKEDIRRLADHITKFSIDALKGWQSDDSSSPDRKPVPVTRKRKL